jgi:hypothetical protein
VDHIDTAVGHEARNARVAGESERTLCGLINE